ncbi:AAA family ATPase [Williamsia sp. CHRR-6]|uniref:AAA family ATPase n=1 Tax=Williamsia sp. CHRR-6 TaxID=2835871 RepID=UPI001BDA7F17|nr:AAA family ATPase [Williamsia sp. CHRR-6]MBT0565730.1 AAA family ATPase [Williamsia sp. CHRR-6]
MTDPRTALESIRLSWAPTPDDVWEPQSALHVDGLHDDVMFDLTRAVADAEASAAGSPLGVVVQGPAGAGKTHLLGQLREHVQTRGGYFFLVKLLDGSDFWRSMVVGILEDLARPTPAHRSQLVDLLHTLAGAAELAPTERAEITGDAPLTRPTLEKFITAVYQRHPKNRRRSQHVLRALVLRNAQSFELQDLGDTFLHLDPGFEDELAQWGITQVQLGYVEIVQNISRLLALGGPAVVAIDQIDTLIALGNSDRPEARHAIEELAHGLMALRETFSRTVCVVSCISASWSYLESHVARSVIDRFRLPAPLQRPDGPDFGPRMLAKRFAPGYASVGFTPPHPTWPVAVGAFTPEVRYTPRELLIRVDQHINTCLRTGVVEELTTLVAPQSTAPVPTIDQPEFADLERRFDQLRAAADPSAALSGDTEDAVVPDLLRTAFTVWLDQLGGGDGAYRQEPTPSSKPPLHGRLRTIIDPDTEREFLWSFRAVASTNAVATQSRIRKAATAAGITTGVTDRRLVLLRATEWPTGAKTQATLEEVSAAGGVLARWTEEDVRTLIALSHLLAERSDHLVAWIAHRRPVDSIDFLSVLDSTDIDSPAPDSPTLDPPGTVSSSVESSSVESNGAESNSATAPRPPAPSPDPQTATAATKAPAGASMPATGPVSVSTPASASAADAAADAEAEATVTVGRTAAGPVTMALEALRKHTALFAGSGSGKTVLIRHLIEQCALAGVSSIVLDVNNDLARMGEQWPSGSRAWTDLERAQADRYFAGTEVVVYTPGRSSGRPLSFQPLPDFTQLLDDPDEFAAAVDSAVASLAPRVNADASTDRAKRRKAMLTQSMRYFARRGGGTVADYAALLSALPPEVSDLRDPGRLALDLADGLRVAMANDTMLGGDADPMDPAALLTPSPGFTARVSVINLAGLTTEDKRDNFVNQLQMALFAWIKKHPAGDRPLGGLFVMDEAQNFAPAGRFTACTQSTLALASQARKYGLGLIFATQAPKGLNNKIPGNASTQFFGKLSSPTQITAAKEVAASKGSEIGDVGRLTAGRFYASLDGAGFVEVTTPLCLTHHPASPPTEEQVLEIARGQR